LQCSTAAAISASHELGEFLAPSLAEAPSEGVTLVLLGLYELYELYELSRVGAGGHPSACNASFILFIEGCESLGNNAGNRALALLVKA
jgi:hypothetical protein